MAHYSLASASPLNFCSAVFFRVMVLLLTQGNVVSLEAESPFEMRNYECRMCRNFYCSEISLDSKKQRCITSNGKQPTSFPGGCIARKKKNSYSVCR